MFKVDKKKPHQNNVIEVVLVFLLTLNIFHFFRMFLLLTLNQLMLAGFVSE